MSWVAEFGSEQSITLHSVTLFNKALLPGTLPAFLPLLLLLINSHNGRSPDSEVLHVNHHVNTEIGPSSETAMMDKSTEIMYRNKFKGTAHSLTLVQLCKR